MLEVLAIDRFEPTAEAMEGGQYPLARPLFIYSDAQIMQEKPQVTAFINFFLTYVHDEIVDVGYFPSSAESLEEAKLSLLGAMQ